MAVDFTTTALATAGRRMPVISNYFGPTESGLLGILESLNEAPPNGHRGPARYWPAGRSPQSIARRIIEAAHEGEDDPIVLCAIALGALNSDRPC